MTHCSWQLARSSCGLSCPSQLLMQDKNPPQKGAEDLSDRRSIPRHRLTIWARPRCLLLLLTLQPQVRNFCIEVRNVICLDKGSKHSWFKMKDVETFSHKLLLHPKIVQIQLHVSVFCPCSQKVSLKERVFSSPRSSGTKGKGSPQHGECEN